MFDGNIVPEHWLSPCHSEVLLSRVEVLYKRVGTPCDTGWVSVLDMDYHLTGGSLVRHWTSGCECNHMLPKNHLSFKLLSPIGFRINISKPIYICLWLWKHDIGRRTSRHQRFGLIWRTHDKWRWIRNLAHRRSSIRIFPFLLFFTSGKSCS